MGTLFRSIGFGGVSERVGVNHLTGLGKSVRRVVCGTRTIVTDCTGTTGTTEVLKTKDLKLERWGISNCKATVYRNVSYADLAVHERNNEEGIFDANGTFTVDTGLFTGRSPKDKWFVKQPPSDKHIWWGNINQPINGEVFDDLLKKVTSHYNTNAGKMYVFDGYCGARPGSRKKIRIISELAWQHHFARNVFIRPSSKEEVANFEPEFTMINACNVTDQYYKLHGLNSEVFIAFNIEQKVALIGGTWYGGEMKKGIFSMMNYWLPLNGIMPMHCAANKGKNGDTALFFGLSGTGKTTLSADPNRALIGDDEHGWDEDGIFNFEGGCYAKTINLDEDNEPDIYCAIRPNALLENVVIRTDGSPDYYDVSRTENGRVSYPIEHIGNYDRSQTGTHPKNIIFLTCDAYGVLPPVSKLTPEEAMYYFLSGYTAKVAGTERGVVEPIATFSTCFGAAFMTLHPTVYADLLQKKIDRHGSHVYLVNTGWTGGKYGVGKRMSIQTTRSCILNRSIERSEFEKEPKFGLHFPKTLGNIPYKVLNPREAWSDKREYDKTADELVQMFKANYKQYVSPLHTDFSPYGPP